MIEGIITGLLWTYFSVSGIFLVLFTGAMIRTGGFQGFADVANMMTGTKRFTSNKVQWHAVIWVIAWPAVIAFFALSKTLTAKR